LWIVSRYSTLDPATPDGQAVFAFFPGYKVLETVSFTDVDVQRLGMP
jgi:hypothetical protein